MGVSVVQHRRFGGWTFELGEESGGSTPGEVAVWLVKAQAGAELAVGHLRSFFFEPAPWGHAERFCQRVARDACYRADIAKGILAFQKRDRIFERSLEWMDTSVDFGPRSAVSVGPGISPRQRRANVAATRRLLGFIDDHLGQIDEVQPGTDEPSPEVLDAEIAPGVQALNAAGIETVFSCQGIGGLLIIEDVELVVEEFHEPLSSVECCALPDDALGRIGDDGDVSRREWRPGRFRLVRAHPSRNRAFRQAMVRLGRSVS